MTTASPRPLPARIPTGSPELDQGRCVLLPGSLTVLAGRPAMGVTTLALRIVAHLADLGDVDVHYHYPRRPWGGELPLRWVAIRRGEDSLRVQARGYDQIALDELYRHPSVLFRSHSCLPTPASVAPMLEDDERRRLVVVDLRPAHRRHRQSDLVDELVDTVNGLEALALVYSAAVLVLAELPRSIDRRRDHRPRLTDLERTGIPLGHVGTALLLSREGYYRGPANDQGPTEVSIVGVSGGDARVELLRSGGHPTSS